MAYDRPGRGWRSTATACRPTSRSGGEGGFASALDMFAGHGGRDHADEPLIHYVGTHADRR